MTDRPPRPWTAHRCRCGALLAETQFAPWVVTADDFAMQGRFVCPRCGRQTVLRFAPGAVLD